MNWQDGPRLLPSASLGRRVIALLIDWTMSRLIASLIGPYLAIQTDFNTLLIFYMEVTVLTILFQSSAGQRIMAIKVVSYPEQLRVPAKKIALRTLLICLVIPGMGDAGSPRSVMGETRQFAKDKGKTPPDTRTA